MQEKFQAVRLVYNSDEVIYAELSIYTHNSYVNGKDRWHKTMLSALNVIVNWKGGKSPPVKQYESIKGVAMTTKGNTGGFKGDCYNFWKYSNMARECNEPRNEVGGNSNQ